MGIGKAGKFKTQDFVKLGGAAMGRVPSAAAAATIVAELAAGALKPDQAAEIALGAQLRAYRFDRYKTKRKEGEEPPAATQLTIAVANAGGGEQGLGCARRAVAKASSSPATSSTSRPTCSIPTSSRAAPPR